MSLKELLKVGEQAEPQADSGAVGEQLTPAEDDAGKRRIGGKTTMPIYERPVWQLMRDDMVEDLEIKKGDIFSRKAVLAWFDEHYPKIKSNGVSQQLRRLSTNARSRVNHTIKPEDHDVFFQVDGSNFRLYDPESDPLPIYPGPKQPKRVAALDEITDEALRKRIEPLFRLPSLPLDTIVREASVVLEHRLRAVVGANSSLTGVNLVEAVLNKEKGALIFSSHPAEQDGVRMLYRGAMQFIRNPPMHKLMEYSEDTARLLIRLIDSLLQLLSEGEPRQVE